MKKQNLITNHPYYASDSNYFSNDAAIHFETVTAFLNDFEDADIDMNQVFRWDIFELTEDCIHEVQIIIIQQRKGIYTPISITSFSESEVTRFNKYLQKHYKNLQELWEPISK